ncbi:MAG: hypothetical protein ACO3JL_06125 [Myxococcota bacterium]
MLTALALVGLLAAAAEDHPVVLVLDLEANGVDRVTADVVSGDVAQSLAKGGRLSVMRQSDLRQLIDVEAQRQSIGCDTNSCLAELAGALGAAYVVFGSVSRLGETHVVQLSLFDSRSAAVLGRESARARRLEDLSSAVTPAVTKLRTSVLPDEANAITARDANEDHGLGLGPWVTATGTAAAVVCGSGAVGAELWLRSKTATGKEYAMTGGVAAIVGVALAALTTTVGGVMWALEDAP